MTAKKNKSDVLTLDIDALLSNQTMIEVKYKKALKLLVRKLPDNWARTISEKTGKSLIMVYKVLAAEKKDTDNAIIKIAIELAEAKKKGINDIITKIQNI